MESGSPEVRMGTIRRNGGPNARPSNPSDHTADGQELVSAEREQLNWTQTHEREVNRPGADLAQITTHHDLDGRLDAIGYQRVWADGPAHGQHLHSSALAPLRNQAGPQTS
jgi:hypothetical protein